MKIDIDFLVDTWAHSTFGKDFAFREHQKETCVDIITSFLNKESNYILQAPTGSGKSVIALIVAGVLSESFKLRGYILISDLSLVKQYEYDIEKYLPDWGVIMGQEHYTCMDNGCTFKLGTCQLEGRKNYDTIERDFPCAKNCSYLVSREKAIKANVTLCTYHHFLCHQNMRQEYRDARKESIFGERDFIICDEAHKIVDIIQSIYSISFGTMEENYLKTLIDACPAIDMKNHTKYKRLVKEMSEISNDSINDNVNIYSKLKDISIIVNIVYVEIDKIIKNGIYKDVTENEFKKILVASQWIMDFDDNLLAYVEIFANNSYKSDMIMTVNEKPFSVIINCLNEVYLMNKYFHSHYSYCLCMSATIGDFTEYKRNTNIKKAKTKEIPSTFDFTNSPIYYIPDYKMSYSCRQESYPKISEMITNIMRMYKDFKGCILVSSYEMAETIKSMVGNDVSDRLLIYSNSSEKRDILYNFKYSTNGVLIGPSLFDGINLAGDMCRFLIIAKVPYMDLKSNFIKKKRDVYPVWYSSQAALSIIQGIGRGVRYNSDWCCSFILDGNFGTLAGQVGNMFDDTFKNRLKIIDKASLMVQK